MLIVSTRAPQRLLDSLRKCMRTGCDPGGHQIQTWSLDGDGNFRHGGDWEQAGKLSARVVCGAIRFSFRWAEGARKAQSYGIVQGRFLELLVNHFGKDVEAVEFVDAHGTPVRKATATAVHGG